MDDRRHEDPHGLFETSDAFADVAPPEPDLIEKMTEPEAGDPDGAPGLRPGGAARPAPGVAPRGPLDPALTERLKRVKAEGRRLLAVYRATRDLDDRNACWIHLQPLVAREAKRQFDRLPEAAPVFFADLYSAGQIGLVRSIERYDPARGAFATYSRPRIRGAIIDYLRAVDFLPRAARDLATAGARVAELIHVADDDPAALRYRADPRSPDPVRELRRAEILAAVAALDPFERKVIEGRLRDQSLTEIALEDGRSLSRICQVHKRALGQLRARMKFLERWALE